MERTYRFKELVDFEENDQCEIKGLQGRDVSQAKALIVDWVRKHANAFLNNRGGSIYIGIEDEGIVTGVKLDRKDRDDLQQRVGQILGEFSPAVDPTQYELSFSPVKSERASDSELYVIELRVLMGREDLYWVGANTPEAYIRQTTSTIKMQPRMIEQRLKKGRAPETIDAIVTNISMEGVGASERAESQRRVDLSRNETLIAARSSVEFECVLPLAFRSGKGQFRFKSVPGRDLIVDLKETVILGSLMFGLKTPFDWQARPYLRKLDTDLFEVVIGQFSMTINESESRELCECIDEICETYRGSIIEAENILGTWSFPVIENDDIFGFSLLQVDLEMWRLMQRFSQEFDYGRGQSDWHVFEHRNIGILISPRFEYNAWLWPVPEVEYLAQLLSYDFVRTETVDVVYAIEDVYLDIQSRENSMRLAWRQQVGKLGIWKANQTRSWLTEKFIPNVLEHYHSHRTPEQAFRDSNQEDSLDEVHDIRSLADRLLRIQMWLSVPRRKIASTLLVPYYQASAELVATASSPTLSYRYISEKLRTADQALEAPLNNTEYSSISEIADSIKRHAERIQGTGYEDSRNADYIFTVVMHVVEHGQIKLDQFHLNRLNSALKPIWESCQFETRHVMPYYNKL